MHLLRMLYHIVRALLLRRRASVADTVRTPMRVWPFDSEWINLNHAKYLHMMEYARWEHGVATGLVRAVWKSRVKAVAGAQYIRYLRPVPLFARFIVDAKVAAFDEKWIFYRQRFWRGEQLVAVGYIKIVFLCGRKKISPEAVFRSAGLDVANAVQDLSDAERAFFI